MKVLNTELMAHPANWLVITLMVVMGSLCVRFLMTAADLGNDPRT